jgi:hypothetical protein
MTRTQFARLLVLAKTQPSKGAWDTYCRMGDMINETPGRKAVIDERSAVAIVQMHCYYINGQLDARGVSECLDWLQPVVIAM